MRLGAQQDDDVILKTREPTKERLDHKMVCLQSPMSVVIGFSGLEKQTRPTKSHYTGQMSWKVSMSGVRGE